MRSNTTSHPASALVSQADWQDEFEACGTATPKTKPKLEEPESVLS
jgi:hypothetical protein